MSKTKRHEVDPQALSSAPANIPGYRVDVGLSTLPSSLHEIQMDLHDCVFPYIVSALQRAVDSRVFGDYAVAVDAGSVLEAAAVAGLKQIRETEMIGDQGGL